MSCFSSSTHVLFDSVITERRRAVLMPHLPDYMGRQSCNVMHTVMLSSLYNGVSASNNKRVAVIVGIWVERCGIYRGTKRQIVCKRAFTAHIYCNNVAVAVSKSRCFQVLRQTSSQVNGLERSDIVINFVPEHKFQDYTGLASREINQDVTT